MFLSLTYSAVFGESLTSCKLHNSRFRDQRVGELVQEKSESKSRDNVVCRALCCDYEWSYLLRTNRKLATGLKLKENIGRMSGITVSPVPCWIIQTEGRSPNFDNVSAEKWSEVIMRKRSWRPYTSPLTLINRPGTVRGPCQQLMCEQFIAMENREAGWQQVMYLTSEQRAGRLV